jgi:aldose sugar dehydrogenase
VDRFVWDANARTLTFDKNLIVLRAFQADADQPERGNHNGGVIRFAGTPKEGERAKLFVIIGDNGRRGMLQNLEQGPQGDGSPDDQFGGPEPDDEHLTGVVFRLNDDGSTPKDNPFFAAGAEMGGETGSNVRRLFAYGIRNSFGLAVDPSSGELWESENGDDAFDEINRIEPGHNGGWVQAMGPLVRLNQWKTIELETEPVGLQQVRWPPSKIAKSPVQARARMVDLLGSHYGDPQFSWKYAVAPAAIGFLKDDSLGAKYEGDLFVGASTPAPLDGYLFRLPLTPNRRGIAWSDPVLADLVADNKEKFGTDESESLKFGQGFGISTDIQTGPKGNLFVVSTSNGAVYEIFRP